MNMNDSSFGSFYDPLSEVEDELFQEFFPDDIVVDGRNTG